jgi:protein-serine/threonine kinase
MASVPTEQAGQNSKGADYVYFDRTTTGFSDEAVPRAKAAQLKLEHYYKEAVEAAIERNTRCAPSVRYHNFNFGSSF